MRIKKETGKPWKLNGNDILELNQFPENCYGFVYLITCSTGEKYIGKKALRSYHTSYERRLNERTGRMNKVRVVTSTESNWKDYFGSSAEIKKLVKERGKGSFTREIIRLCSSKKSLTYWELAEQCKADVLDAGKQYLNDNILGKFYRKDFEETL